MFENQISFFSSMQRVTVMVFLRSIKLPTAKPIGRVVKYRFFLSVFFFILALPQASLAEYRVFTLKIYKQDNPQDFRLVESTLDNEQYRYYNYVAPNEVVTYIATWRCYGRTGDFLPHCANPKGQIPTTAAATP
jgi:hypothetical protein